MKWAPSAAALAAAIALAVAGVCAAQSPPAAGPPRGGPPEGGHAAKLLLTLAPAKAGATLAVSSPVFKNGQDIPYEYTQYRGNHFPGVTWSRGPDGTKSYVVIMQGALGGGDDISHGASIHFILYNVPANMTALKTGLTTPPDGATYGENVHGTNQAYAGPHTHNFVKHAYHLQVFALDTVLPVDPKQRFPALLAGMNGHVLASGEVVGMAAMDPDSPEAAELKAKQAQAKPAA